MLCSETRSIVIYLWGLYFFLSRKIIDCLREISTELRPSLKLCDFWYLIVFPAT